jgi:dolichyl-phosphate beta-glucosyltransferase
MSNPYVSIVIPAYNELNNLEKGVLYTIRNYLSSREFSYEVILVDDGSTDGSVQLLENFCASDERFRLIRKVHSGKAFTIINGVKKCKGNLILIMDMDQATPISELEKLLFCVETKNCDAAIGSRGKIRKNAPIQRKILSWGQIHLRNLLLGFKDITDTQCGFKLFKSAPLMEAVDKLYIFNYSKMRQVKTAAVNAGFDVELLYVFQRQGYKMCEVNVDWDYKKSNRVNLLRDAIRGIQELLTLKTLSLLGKYSKRDLM